MNVAPFPHCRHGAPETAAGVRPCSSPKLAGLKMVTPALCQQCFCRDHELTSVSVRDAAHLLPCAYLGPATGQQLGKPRARTGRRETVYACRHPSHPHTTDAQCRHCPDYLFPMLSPHTPVADVQRLLALPPRTQPDGWWHWPNVQEAQRRAADQFLATIPDFPAECHGRGIVIVGGGKYLVAAYVTVRVLRHVGCRLPIELWHLAGEVDPAMRRLLADHGVVCVDADETARRHPFRFLNGHWWKGWQLKPYALAHSSFREVLLLDADCYPTRDPEFLFDGSAYRDLGAVSWPDTPAGQAWLTPQKWPIFGLEPWPDIIESGQLLVNKQACWRELHLALHYNAQADFTYRIIYGDKDTFNIAWRKLGRPFARLWPVCAWDTHTILQYDERGQVLFQHRAGNKFTLEPAQFSSTSQYFGANHYTPRMAHEDFCFEVLAELKKLWKPWWRKLVKRWHPDDPYPPTAEFRRYYQVKYDVAARLRPRRIAEIGVRAGYSAFAFLSAVPRASYLGIDADLPVHGGEPGFFDYARSVLQGFNVTLQRADSRQLDALPGPFDLVHVDGDHSYEGCWHDLQLACASSRHVLVDDYDSHAEVRRACDDFLARRPDMAVQYLDDGLRGNLLLTLDRPV